MTSTEPPHQISDRLIHFVQFCMYEFLIPRKRRPIVMFIYAQCASTFCKVRGELTANSAAYFTQATGESTGFVSILRKKTLVCSVPGQTAGARGTGTARAEADRTAASASRNSSATPGPVSRHSGWGQCLQWKESGSICALHPDPMRVQKR